MPKTKCAKIHYALIAHDIDHKAGRVAKLQKVKMKPSKYYPDAPCNDLYQKVITVPDVNCRVCHVQILFIVKVILHLCFTISKYSKDYRGKARTPSRYIHVDEFMIELSITQWTRIHLENFARGGNDEVTRNREGETA